MSVIKWQRIVAGQYARADCPATIQHVGAHWILRPDGIARPDTVEMRFYCLREAQSFFRRYYRVEGRTAVHS